MVVQNGGVSGYKSAAQLGPTDEEERQKLTVCDSPFEYWARLVSHQKEYEPFHIRLRFYSPYLRWRCLAQSSDHVTADSR